jgi:hypothetical protein
MWIEASVDETDLGAISVGDKVSIEFTWNDDDVTYDGTVAMISAIGTANEESVTYPVYITFTPDETVKYGMTVVVSSQDGEDTDAAAQDEAQATDEEQPTQGETPTQGEAPVQGETPTQGEAPVQGEMPTQSGAPADAQATQAPTEGN